MFVAYAAEDNDINKLNQQTWQVKCTKKICQSQSVPCQFSCVWQYVLHYVVLICGRLLSFYISTVTDTCAMMLKTFLVFVVFLCYFGRAMPPNSIVARNLINGKGLYDEGDKVAVLNVTNFKNTVFGTKNAWVVQFYNSWCGHCFAFAPKYKALAADVQGT